MRRTFLLTFVALCAVGIMLPLHALSHNDGGGSGGGGRDSRNSSFGGRGPDVQAISGIENMPFQRPGEFHYGSHPRGSVPINDGPERHSPAERAEIQKFQNTKQQLIKAVINDTIQDAFVLTLLSPCPPAQAAYKAWDSPQDAYVVSTFLLDLMNQATAMHRNSYTRSALGSMGTTINTHPEGVAHTCPNTPMSGMGGGFIDMKPQDLF